MRTVSLSILSFLESYLKSEEIINTVFVDTCVYHSDKHVLDRKLKWNLKRLLRKSCSPTASKTFALHVDAFENNCKN